MDEFSVISKYFSAIACVRKDVIFGIGDDAACLELPLGMQLLVSCDTLIADVHFHSSWDAYDIAYKMGFKEVFEFIDQGIRKKNKDSVCLIMWKNILNK